MFRGNEEIPLSRLSFEFLLALVEAAPNLVTHDELSARVWGRKRIVTQENLAKRALLLRNSLGDHADDPKYFEVLRGQGYRLLPTVAKATGATAQRAEPTPPVFGAASPGNAAKRVAVTMAAIIAVVAAVVLVRIAPTAPENARLVRFELVTEPDTSFVSTSYSRDLAISSDGAKLAYTSQGNSIVLRHFDEIQPRRIVNVATDIRNPTFSPDGNYLAFLDGGALKTVSTETPGQIELLANVGQFTDGDINWTSEGSILVANSRGLMRVPEHGGAPELLLVPDASNAERSFGAPSLLPGGRKILFSIEPTEAEIGSRIAMHDLETRQTYELISNAAEPSYLASGHLAYVAERDMRVAQFDPDEPSVASEYTELASSILVHTNGTAVADVSDDGTLVYVSGTAPPVRDLVWVERDGTPEVLPVPALNYTYPRLSPHGTYIALDVRWPESDIWVWDLARKSLIRMTRDPAENALPVWHPDGRRLAFGDGRDGFSNVYWHSLNSGGEPVRLTEETMRQLPFSISPDGRHLLVGEDQPDGNWNMWSLNLETNTRTELLHGPHSYLNTDISPDGRWLVYQSNESGDIEIYVRPFPKVDDGRWKISLDGGSKPMWSRDGSEIFYIDPEGWLVAVEVETFPGFSASRTHRLFDTKTLADRPYYAGARDYDLSVDGRRFLFTRNVAAASSPRSRIIVVMNTSSLIDAL